MLHRYACTRTSCVCSLTQSGRQTPCQPAQFTHIRNKTGGVTWCGMWCSLRPGSNEYVTWFGLFCKHLSSYPSVHDPWFHFYVSAVVQSVSCSSCRYLVCHQANYAYRSTPTAQICTLLLQVWRRVENVVLQRNQRPTVRVTVGSALPSCSLRPSSAHTLIQYTHTHTPVLWGQLSFVTMVVAGSAMCYQPAGVCACVLVAPPVIISVLLPPLVFLYHSSLVSLVLVLALCLSRNTQSFMYSSAFQKTQFTLPQPFRETRHSQDVKVFPVL